MIRQSRWGNYSYTTQQGTSAPPSPNVDGKRSAAVDEILARLSAQRQFRGQWTATGQQPKREFDAGSVGECKSYHPWRRVYSEER